LVEVTGAAGEHQEQETKQLGPKPPPAQRKYDNMLQSIVSTKDRLLRNTDYIEEELTMAANGTAESIIQWSLKSKFDKYQKTAFEICTATFMLTSIHNEEDQGNISQDMGAFKEEQQQKLRILAHIHKRGGKQQVVALLHSPGGSRKSWVIDLVMHYTKEFTGHVHRFTFERRTIIISAMTGCAAAPLIQGETLHTSLGLCKKQIHPDAEERKSYKGTRLIIVDEISFASKKVLQKMDKKRLKLIKQTPDVPFGGVSIIFVGDFWQLDPINERPLYESTFLVKSSICFWNWKESIAMLMIQYYGEISCGGTETVPSSKAK